MSLGLGISLTQSLLTENTSTKYYIHKNSFDCGCVLGIYVESGYSSLEGYVTIHNHSMCKNTALVGANRLSFN